MCTEGMKPGSAELFERIKARGGISETDLIKLEEVFKRPSGDLSYPEKLLNELENTYPSSINAQGYRLDCYHGTPHPRGGSGIMALWKSVLKQYTTLQSTLIMYCVCAVIILTLYLSYFIDEYYLLAIVGALILQLLVIIWLLLNIEKKLAVRMYMKLRRSDSVVRSISSPNAIMQVYLKTHKSWFSQRLERKPQSLRAESQVVVQYIDWFINDTQQAKVSKNNIGSFWVFLSLYMFIVSVAAIYFLWLSGHFGTYHPYPWLLVFALLDAEGILFLQAFAAYITIRQGVIKLELVRYLRETLAPNMSADSQQTGQPLVDIE